MVSDDGYAYAYLQESSVESAGDCPAVSLATSGGCLAGQAVAHPHFFDGFVERAEIVAVALLVVARVARTRFYTPPGIRAAALRSADPVVTSDGQRLRFESFSPCCGVYCRLDLLPAGLDRAPSGIGTTSVDFNQRMRDALAAIGGLGPVRLAVGADEVRAPASETSVVERRVAVPARWIKGFGDVQAIAAGMGLRLTSSGVALRRFLQAPPHVPQRNLVYAVAAGSRLRLTARPASTAVPITAVDRLRVVEPLLRHATTVRVYTPDTVGEAPNAWVVDLPGARLTVTLSPGAGSGFDTEADLSDDRAAADADVVSAVLHYDPTIDLRALAQNTGLEQPELRRALTHLAAGGQLGFDLTEGSYFHRELPYHLLAKRMSIR